MRIEPARSSWASWIASCIMQAMSDECCLHFTGPSYGLADFHHLLTRLVEREDTQYSYTNTIVAVSEEDELMGICVSYNGAQLLHLRQAFIQGVAEAFGTDHSHMTPETQNGEWYIDSLCVDEHFRGKGVAKALIAAAADRARMQGADKIGLLADYENEPAQRLYRSLGFEHADTREWGGHKMLHLQKNL